MTDMGLAAYDEDYIKRKGIKITPVEINGA